MIPLRHTERTTPDANRHQRNTCRHPVPRLARRPFLVSRTRHCCSTITAGTAYKGDLNKADQTLICAASGGFTVVAPDCVEHGERRTDAWSRATFNGWIFICEAMDQTRQEAPALLDAALALPNLSAASPEGAGVSIDGLIAQTVFTQEKRSSFYQADVLVSPCPGGHVGGHVMRRPCHAVSSRSFHGLPGALYRWRPGHGLPGRHQRRNSAPNQQGGRTGGALCRQRSGA